MWFVFRQEYFTELTTGKALFYFCTCLYVLTVAMAAVIEPFLSIPCTDEQHNYTPKATMPNPEFVDTICDRLRFWQLAGLTREECSFARRLVMAVILGGVIGWERRQADRPAGIRTMALVSLASCLFTIGSAYAFRLGPQDWDASRISAAIPSGVGFLGAGLIFKGPINKNNENDMPIVHGLTTAASLWLSAAVGIACGGTLYFAATLTTALLLLLLRFGPRYWELHDDDDDEEDDEEARTASLTLSQGEKSYGGLSSHHGGGVSFRPNASKASGTELSALMSNPSIRASQRKSIRNTPQLL